MSASTNRKRYTFMTKLRRWQIPGEIYHVVFRTRHLKPFLPGPDADCVTREIKLLAENGHAIILAWVIMPNHVHLLTQPKNGQIGKIIQLVKGRSSKEIKKRHPELDKTWEKRYYDRRLRHVNQVPDRIEYIINNPVTAGLCERPEDWPWSSIHEDLENPP